jgi:hypothetical protein
MKGKGGGALLAFLGKPKGGESDESGEYGEGADLEGDGMESAKMTAAEDAMAAFKSGDATALSDALTRHYDACAGGGGMAMPEEGDEDEEY